MTLNHPARYAEALTIDPYLLEPADLQLQLESERMTPHIGYWADAWRRFRQNRIAVLAMIAIFLLIFFAFVGPLFSPYTYAKGIRGDESLRPCLAHPFGTDNLGRDLLVRCMIGARISLSIGLGSALIVLVIGSIYGAISGLIGGLVDTVMMRIVDMINALPTVLMVIAIKLVIETPLANLIESNSFFMPLRALGPGIIAVFLVYGLLYWIGMARIVRGQVLQIKRMEFVDAAIVCGSNRSRLIRKHLLPNCVGQLVVTTMLQIPSAIFTEAFLSFLGIGVSRPMASLGSLCSDALNGIVSYPYRMIFPAVLISLIILVFNLFGDGLRDALDPRLKK
ncbi:peptide ABC transporter permease [Clostridia bacterium]|nr:peptide ABC transporter permease [Clostridia bacterium]